MSRTDLTYLRYLNGYRKLETGKLEKITWLDILRTVFQLGKINIHLLSYNLKAVIQHSWRMNFGLYFPSDPQTFLRLTRMLKENARNGRGDLI